MPKEFVSTSGVNQWVRAVTTAWTKSVKDVEEAVKDVGTLLQAAVAKRVWPVRKINIQDSNRPRTLGGRKPIRVRTAGTQGEVELSGYWANARSIPVQNVMKSIGAERMLVRSYLYINPRGAKSGPDNLRLKIRFAEAPRLEVWAKQGDAPKTWQYDRHAVRLPVAALERLAMAPAVSASRDAINARWDEVADNFTKDATR